MVEDQRASISGTVWALISFLLWGILPVYWKWLGAVPPPAQLAHRVLWSGVTLAVVVPLLKWRELRTLFREPRAVLVAMLAGLLLAANWGIYIWAISVDRIVESSLGYYINPLVSVFLGVVFLRERLTAAQVIAFVLAVAGVLVLTFSHGQFPWVSIALGFSFGVYGLVKKVNKLSSSVSLLTEMILLSPVAFVYLVFVGQSGEGSFGGGDGLTTLLLAGTGFITVTPLLLFGAAARLIPLSRVGFLQYLAPTAMLLIGTIVYGEPFTTAHIVSFSFIWSALAIYTVTLVRGRRQTQRLDDATSRG